MLFRIELLEHIVDINILEPNTQKSKMEVHFKSPTNRSEIQRIIGIGNYLLRFSINLRTKGRSIYEL